MRFTTLLSVLVCSLATLAASGQSFRDEIAANPRKSAGVYYAYAYDNPAQTPAPKGYKPFYISHYGRHGSRWLLLDSEYTSLKTWFDTALAADALTARGREVYERVKRIYDDGINRGGDLTPLGAGQHREIAGRMFRAYPEVFRGAARIDAQSTVVVRCVLSMSAFCERLKELNPRLCVTREAGNRTTRYLNFFSKCNPEVSPEYLDFISKGAWTRDFERIEAQYIRPDRLMKELFSDSEFVKQIDARKVMKGLFYAASDMQNIDLGISLYDLFTTDELYGLSLCDNYRFYVIRGPSLLNRRFPEYYAKALLEDFLVRADRAVAGGDVTADLRFGHDGDVMPLVTLLQLEGYGDVKTTDPERIAEQWPVYRITPMASNIQLIFYRRKGSDDVLVKFRLNECEMRIPVASDCAPYYRWRDVRAFYDQVMDSLTNPAEKTIKNS